MQVTPPQLHLIQTQRLLIPAIKARSQAYLQVKSPSRSAKLRHIIYAKSQNSHILKTFRGSIVIYLQTLVQ